MSTVSGRAATLLLVFLGTGACEWGSPPQRSATADERTTFTVRYRVRIDSPGATEARVRWDFVGIDEIPRLRLEFPKDRFQGLRGTGNLEWKDGEAHWRPGGPYGHLEYRVKLRHRREAGKGFDSYAAGDWVITRAQDLFPRTHVTFETDVEANPKSRTEVIFELPKGWQSHTAMPPDGEHRFRPSVPGKRYDRPKGWIALGRLDVDQREIEGTEVTVARVPGTAIDAAKILDLLTETLPLLTDLLGTSPPRLLFVSGPDPMWRGALSGEWSLFLHADRPLREKDLTSPLLHELFHVLAPFRPAPDGLWVTEGLAEYYSLELQRRVERLDEESFRRGLELFRKQGDWNRNLTGDRSLAVVNNSAPLVVAVIDGRIRNRGNGTISLDDVVRNLVDQAEDITTARFLGAVNTTSKLNFTPFFQRHVYRGVPPELGS